jgi:predicted metalloenzyme YecM
MLALPRMIEETRSLSQLPLSFSPCSRIPEPNRQATLQQPRLAVRDGKTCDKLHDWPSPSP